MRVVVALGGNALLRRGDSPDAEIQVKHVAEAAPTLAELADRLDLVLVHGNGPQVGMLAIESDADASLTRPYPLSDLVAETQGMIGYWLQQGLANAGAIRPVVTLVTQTVVDLNDPAFAAPSKFVGAVYGEQQARDLAMGPKVAAACGFVETTGGRAAIGSLDAAADVIAGRSGTQVHP